MKPDKIEIGDLLADHSFLIYCKRSSQEDVAFWENYLEENPDHRPLVNLAKEKFSELFNVLAEVDFLEQEARLKKSMDLPERVADLPTAKVSGKRPGKILSIVLKFTAVAAVLIFGVLFVINYHSHGNNKSVKKFQAALGERKSIQLPDGSQVTMNGGSEIKINENFGVSSRDIYLEGEAFFDVKHNGKVPFIVHTHAMDVKALGTAFNVKAYLNEKVTEASLIRGLVEVSLKDGEHRIVFLRPNQKVKWESPTATPVSSTSPIREKELPSHKSDSLLTNVNVTNDGDIKEIAWKENKLVFEDEAFGDIAKLLERWYGVKIEFIDNTIRDYRFTGTFENEDINTVLDFLKESRGFNYQTEPGNTSEIKLSK